MIETKLNLNLNTSEHWDKTQFESKYEQTPFDLDFNVSQFIPTLM